MGNELSFLFSPIRINSMELKNRAVMPPMGTAYGAKDGGVTDRLVEYLACRPRGKNLCRYCDTELLLRRAGGCL